MPSHLRLVIHCLLVIFLFFTRLPVARRRERALAPAILPFLPSPPSADQDDSQNSLNLNGSTAVDTSESSLLSPLVSYLRLKKGGGNAMVLVTFPTPPSFLLFFAINLSFITIQIISLNCHQLSFSSASSLSFPSSSSFSASSSL